MGSFEVFCFWAVTWCFTTLIIYLLSTLSFKNVYRRFRLLRKNRREFYECGCRTPVQKPVKLASQFLVICVFFVVYDVELLFSFPLISNITTHSLVDFCFFMFLYVTFLFSLMIDYKTYLSKWRI